MQPISCSEDTDPLQETAAGDAGEVDFELQAEHIFVVERVCIDVNSKLRWWDLLGKFDSLGDGVVTWLDGALDLQICLFTACSV
jgi:hypothetical protein